MTLLEELQNFTTSVFSTERLVPEEPVRESGKVVMAEIKSKGFAIRKNQLDKQARSVFVTIQASAERKAVDDVAKATTDAPKQLPEVKVEKPLESPASNAVGSDEVVRKAYVSLQTASEKAIVDRISAVKALGRIAKSIWIIHTPTIATPCVTEGTVTPSLLAEEIMKDETRKALTLSRASIVRDYLKAGGVLVVAYDKDQREEKLDAANKVIVAGRTPKQIEIFEQLKKEFPAQIIDFPMGINEKKAQLGLKDPQNPDKFATYPDDMIGATYLIEDTYGQRFEMTNLGVQANNPHDDATWGVWMQNRSNSVPEVTQRMSKVLSFLEKAGLNQALDKHAQQYKINPDDFAPLFSRYLNLQVNADSGIGCRMQ